MTTSQSEGQEFPSKLPTKCEGGRANFCTDKLSKHFPNTERFPERCWRRCFKPTREETKAGHWIQHTGTQRRDVRGSPEPQEHSGGSRTESSQCTRCRGRGRRGVLAGKEAEPQHPYLPKLGEPPSARSRGMDGHHTLNRGKAWQCLIPSKTKGCTKWETCTTWLGCE